MKKAIGLLLASIFSICSFGCAAENNSFGSGASESTSEILNEKEETYSVSIVYCSKGGTAILDKGEVQAGGSATVTMQLIEGYKFKSIMVNGKNCSAEVVNNQYTISNISEDIFIRVYFEILEKGISYVSAENAPVLDGTIDSVWDNATPFYVTNVVRHNGTYTEWTEKNSWCKILWTETGFYFLGYVYDSTVVDGDRLNIWFSEEYVYAASTDEKAIDYSTNPEDGNYLLCVNPKGEYVYSGGLDLTAYWDENSTAVTVADGYIVEAFVPCLSVENLSAGRTVGLDISIDYFSKTGEVTIEDDRDAYANWYGQGSYWSNVGALKKLTLVKD